MTNRRRHGTQDKIAILCLFQAVVVIFSILYVLVYIPHVLVDDVVNGSSIIDEAHAQTIADLKAKHEQDVKYKRYWLQGVHKSSVNGQNYTFFRYDNLRQYDIYQKSKAMINDEGEYSYLSKSESFMSEETPGWFNRSHDYCNGCFVVYGIGKQVVALKDVTMYPQLAHGKVGGEDIEEVINQHESREKITIEKGYFVLDTHSEFNVEESLSFDLSIFLAGLVTKDSTFVPFHQRKRPDMTSVITIRYEYANFYHTTMSWYDIFLIMVLFKINPYNLEVIWLDAHPKSKLDDAWEILYGSPIRAGGLTDPVKYGNIIWNGFGSKSHINLHNAETLPFVESYRHFVLNRFDITDDHVLNCKELRITIIWRRDHVAHPRNPSGHIARQILNEEVVWKAIKTADIDAIVNGVQLDRLSVEEQLQLIAKTDILIGMHGAGLSHILYLPNNSGVIELYPYYVSVGNAHFRSMAKWRRLRYMTWTNRDKALEKATLATEIPKELIQDMVKAMKESMCKM